jgi:signal transduction histidine kinase
MIGMIGPMGVLLFFVTYSSFKTTNRYMARLIEAIEKVADGDFAARLDEPSGPYRHVFDNFNTMCEELAGVQTLRDDFIDQFSHEFKTPIAAINGFATLLLEEDPPEAERRKYLRIIADESARLASLADSTLLLSRLETQRIVEDKAPYSLDEQIKECVILLEPLWSRKKLELSADLEAAIYMGNAAFMKQVWLNLLDNAIKFTPERGEISVSLKRRKGSLVATVADNGRGMSEEEARRAFEKYYRGDSARSMKGLGLGLAIAKRIVDLAGGRIEVLSAIGEGSEFTVYLPSPI